MAIGTAIGIGVTLLPWLIDLFKGKVNPENEMKLLTGKTDLKYPPVLYKSASNLKKIGGFFSKIAGSKFGKIAGVGILAAQVLNMFAGDEESPEQKEIDRKPSQQFTPKNNLLNFAAKAGESTVLQSKMKDNGMEQLRQQVLAGIGKIAGKYRTLDTAVSHKEVDNTIRNLEQQKELSFARMNYNTYLALLGKGGSQAADQAMKEASNYTSVIRSISDNAKTLGNPNSSQEQVSAARRNINSYRMNLKAIGQENATVEKATRIATGMVGIYDKMLGGMRNMQKKSVGASNKAVMVNGAILNGYRNLMEQLLPHMDEDEAEAAVKGGINILKSVTDTVGGRSSGSSGGSIADLLKNARK